MSSATSDPRPEGSFPSRAPKGKACLACRRRKMKCDCVRPVCGQCVRFNREHDCEFTDGDQRSRTQILEENIAALQARLKLLESPTSEPSTSTSPESLPGARESRSGGHVDDGMDMSPEREVEGLVHTKLNSQFAFNHVDEPPLTVAQGLIEVFMRYAYDFGFFLNRARFVSYCTRKFSTTAHHAPVDPLLCTVYLWGSILSQDDRWTIVEETYATHCASLLISTASSEGNFLHIIQAEVLLANYYFHSARFSEGRNHLSIASSLVVTHKLGKIRNQIPLTLNAKLDLVDMSQYVPPPESTLDEGERIHCFWTVYSLDKVWAMAVDRQSFIVDDGSPSGTVETPWPLSMKEFEEGDVPESYRGGHTMMSFLHQPFVPENQPAVMSPVCLRSQAVALLSKAGWLSSAASIDSAPHLEFLNEHDILIEKFILHLPLLETLSSFDDPELIRHLVLTHMIARLSMMQLHNVFIDSNLTSTVKCLSASKAIAAAYKVILPKRSDIIRGAQLHADPFLLICLTASAKMMVNDLSNAKNGHHLWRTGPLCNSHTYMGVVLNEYVETIEEANRGSALTETQVAKIGAMRAVGGV
ncbi:hypothetical protein BXZ70DRAFT_920252 [Cristinia sonorae]|uniref:Zn(2)-C6 fungal-type domain-containing protein n=1 Tax=Cristinia sonorae TaxID=1940300 RepID=A0A8K0UXJ1_9AGAR|nr:hypothetical protein BXZ70DRAFT_920252 [Cristinia sonorae]